MPEGESLPKSNKSKDWLAHADKKLEEFKKYHTNRPFNIGPRSLGLGFGKRKAPLSDVHSRLLSQQELSARSKGMRLQREEADRGELAGMKKGGKVRAAGRRRLHRGEMVRRGGR